MSCAKKFKHKHMQVFMYCVCDPRLISIRSAHSQTVAYVRTYMHTSMHKHAYVSTYIHRRMKKRTGAHFKLHFAITQEAETFIYPCSHTAHASMLTCVCTLS